MAGLEGSKTVVLVSESLRRADRLTFLEGIKDRDELQRWVDYFCKIDIEGRDSYELIARMPLTYRVYFGC